ncbi:MAG TPA: YceI family protein [Bacteroidales bacterium]|nr:YceI family protein [Bacteroidales bacterium]
MRMIAMTALMLIAVQVSAQRFATKTGTIRFYSEAPAENIEAINRQVNSALDTQNGDFVFRLLMKGFQFEKALMQEHFNENYVESNKFPNATFSGKVLNADKIDWSKNGTHEVEVSGDLTIKGITRKITEKGTFEVKDGTINGKSKFYIKLADYDIRIPKAVVKNIAETIEINVDVSLTALNN